MAEKKEPTDNPLYRKLSGLDPVAPVDTTPAKDLDKLLAGEVKPEEVHNLDLTRRELKDVNADEAKRREKAEVKEEIRISELAEKAASRESKAQDKDADSVTKS